jgi:hypothetical protein
VDTKKYELQLFGEVHVSAYLTVEVPADATPDELRALPDDIREEESLPWADDFGYAVRSLAAAVDMTDEPAEISPAPNDSAVHMRWVRDQFGKLVRVDIEDENEDGYEED